MNGFECVTNLNVFAFSVEPSEKENKRRRLELCTNVTSAVFSSPTDSTAAQVVYTTN